MANRKSGPHSVLRAPMAEVRRLQGLGYLTSSELARKAGISLRQLQWWDEHHVLRPEKLLVHKRLYAPLQLDSARKLAALRKAGVSLQKIRQRKYLDLQFTQVVRVSKPVLIPGVLAVPR